MPEPKLGVIHYNFPDMDWAGFLDYCRRTGFEYVELGMKDVWPADEPDPAGRAREVRGQLEDHGLKVAALGAGNDFLLLDAGAIDEQVERMRRIVEEIAPALGTDVLRTEGGWPKDSVPPERYVEAISACLRRCAGFAEAAGVKLALDNHGPVTNDADLQVRIFEAVGSQAVGATLDTMNYRWFGHDLATVDRFYDVIAPHVKHTHMKDGRGSRENYKGAVLGEGEVHLDRAVAALRGVGYDGVWCVEYEGPDAAAGAGHARCLHWLRENL